MVHMIWCMRDAVANVVVVNKGANSESTHARVWNLMIIVSSAIH
jgi:hypothetical protein